MADELRNATLATDRSALEEPVDRTGRAKRARVRNAELLAAALALIAGFIDAYGMITFGVYVSFMSGNTTQAGYQTAEGAFGSASLSALAILFFMHLWMENRGLLWFVVIFTVFVLLAMQYGWTDSFRELLGAPWSSYSRT